MLSWTNEQRQKKKLNNRFVFVLAEIQIPVLKVTDLLF